MTANRLSLFVRRFFAALATGIALCVIVAVVAIGAGLAVGYRPIVITSGSMSPTIPTGSLVVARPTAQAAVGDILVMQRDGRATITHRVVGIDPNPGGRAFAVTRGDANAQIDAAPYLLGESELVARWIVPGVGRAMMGAGTPIAGVIIVSLGCLVAVVTLLRRLWQPTGRTADAAHRTDADGGRTEGDAGRDGDDDGECESADVADVADPGDGDPGAGDTGDEVDAEPAVAVGARRPGGRVARRLTAVAMVAALATAGGTAWALFIEVADVAGNVFSTAECVDSELAGVQRGQVTVSSAAAVTATIDAVEPSESFLLFSARGAGSDPLDTVVLGELLNATTVRFEAVGPSPTTVEWSVVEYACGVSVQRGSATGSGTAQLDVTIDEVPVAGSFVIASVLPGSAGGFSGSALTTAELTDGQTVRLTTASPAVLAAGDRVAWQVVTFEAPGDAGVHTATVTVNPGSPAVTVTLPAPVDPASTLVLASLRTALSDADIGARMIRARLTGATTVEIDRLATSGSLTVVVQVIELREGSLVEAGTVDLASGATTGTGSFAPVDVARSVALSTVAVPGLAAGGSTDQQGGEVVGEGAATLTLTNATTVTVQRGSSASTASFAWQVVTWGGPSWGDPDARYRQRIDVTAGAVSTPDGYTTSFTFDHAALVDLGLSQASGDDVRLWRFDGTTWTELDRVLDDDSAWDGATTTVWFRTREVIAAGAVRSYWLYYGDTTPGAPPADPAEVWLVDEGFESGTLGAFEDRTGGTGWYAADPWTRRIDLTVAAAGSALADQVVLVRLVSADLAANVQADGSDIRFTAADGTTPLSHEVEYWDAATGTLAAWVRVPLLSAGAPTTIRLLYGAADAPAQQRSRDAWASEAAVWHLARDPGGAAPTLDDSSPNAHDGLAVGGPVRVQTPSGPAADLAGGARFESAPFRLPAGGLTISAWFELDATASDTVLVAQGDPDTSGAFELGVAGGAGSGTARFRVRVGGSVVTVAGGTVTPGAWHHLAAVCDGSACTLHLDGVQVATQAAAGARSTAELPVVLGADASGAEAVDGRLGQVRISPTAWSAAAVAFAEANLRSPSVTVAAGAPAGGSWFGQGTWSSRRPLTVDPAKVADALSDFPVLVQTTLPGVSGVAQADGDDLVFTASDGVTRLDHQLESWNATTGAVTAWVRVPSLSSSSPTTFFAYFGNPSAVDQTDPEGVWGPDADLALLGG